MRAACQITYGFTELRSSSLLAISSLVLTVGRCSNCPSIRGLKGYSSYALPTGHDKEPNLIKSLFRNIMLLLNAHTTVSMDGWRHLRQDRKASHCWIDASLVMLTL